MSGELRALTGLRMIAALYVFLFHVHIRWPISDQPQIANFLSQGAVGMTLFFMLSGFILAYRYQDGDLDVRDYVANRFARIYPIYLVAALITLPWLLDDLALLDAAGDRSLLFGLVQLAVIVLAVIFMIQAWIPQLFSYWNIGASWSLSAEAFFYTVFIFVVRPFLSLNLKTTFALCLGLYVLTVLPELAYRTLTPRPNLPLQLYYAMPIFRLSEFLIGVLLFNLHAKIKMNPRTLDIACLSLCALLCGMLLTYGALFAFYTGWSFLAVPAIGASLLALAQPASLPGAWLGSDLMVWGGRISYCFYLFQSFVLKLAEDLTEFLPENPVALVLLLIAALTVMSHFGHVHIEEPARRWLRSRPRAATQPEVVS